MPCAQLSELPPPPKGKSGWAWTEGSNTLPAKTSGGCEWPRVTVVTPSYNQADFVEETLRSVLLQGYPNLEYLVLDGGSTDGSVAILEKYAPWIDYWVSEPDGGQSAAINHGLGMGTGEFCGWINSDDLLHQNALFEHATRVGFASGMVYVGLCAHIAVDSSKLSMRESGIHSLEDLLRVREVWRRGRHITQAEVLFPRQLFLDVGALDVSNHYSMDYDLWGRFFLAGAEFRNTGIPFGMFRLQPDQKTGNRIETTYSLVDAALKLLDQSHGIPTKTREILREDLLAYREEYPELLRRNRGLLDRMGVPPPLAMPIRRMKARLAGLFQGKT